MKRSGFDLTNDEIKAVLNRWKRKRFLLARGIALLVVSIAAYVVGLSIPASLAVGAVGSIACVIAGYMHLTQERFAPAPEAEPAEPIERTVSSPDDWECIVHDDREQTEIPAAAVADLKQTIARR